jgi:hypothetical protein
MITAYLFRTIGPIILRSGLGGGLGGGGQTNNKGKDDDDDDDFGSDEDDDDDKEDGDRKVSISLPTFPPESAEKNDEEDDDKSLSLNDLKKRSTVVADDESKEPTKIDLFSGLAIDENDSAESTTGSEESTSESNFV